ncbi:ATP-binding cassette subfamily A, member 1, putative [Leishmania donovani]|uniref:ATP-binding cassette subfamily A, member 1, putative n=1 Tax=Leishmania donovani TaxID=5661 RepID=A0A3S7X0L1_LEIDO|nr:ATP-binding cassette subfamily A, member 1, putative [Leishmania donovani]
MRAPTNPLAPSSHANAYNAYLPAFLPSPVQRPASPLVDLDDMFHDVSTFVLHDEDLSTAPAPAYAVPAYLAAAQCPHIQPQRTLTAGAPSEAKDDADSNDMELIMLDTESRSSRISLKQRQQPRRNRRSSSESTREERSQVSYARASTGTHSHGASDYGSYDYSLYPRRQSSIYNVYSDESLSAYSRRSGSCQQLGHTILRVLILMKRDWCSTLCEFLIPIFFLGGSILLWALYGKTSADDFDYYNSLGPLAVLQVAANISSSLCYNASLASGIAGLTPCLEGQKYYCPHGRGIPTGFCYDPPLKNVVAQLLGALPLTTSPMLPLDTLIACQWVAMDQSIRASTPFSYGGLLYFAPRTPEVESLVSYMRTQSKLFDNAYGGTFATAADATSHILSLTHDDPPTWGVVELDSYTADTFNVKIMVNSSALPATSDSILSGYLGGLDMSTNSPYIFSGYTTLQTLVYNHYTTSVLGKPATKPLAYTAMPTKAYNTSSFLLTGASLAPLILVLGFLYPVSQLTKRIVVEKELRIREAMLIMGLSEWTMYLAWLVVYGVWYTVVSIIITVLLRLTYLPESSPGYVFFMFLLFSWSTIALSGAIAAVFSKARLAAIIAPLIYFAMAIPLFAMERASGGAKMGIMILGPSAFAVGFALLFEHEVNGGAGVGALAYFRDEPKLIVVFVLLFVDIFVYLLLMMYFDRVVPKEWGTTKNPLFFVIDPVRWCFCRRRAGDADNDGDVPGDGRAEDGVFEAVDPAVEEAAAVRIRGLRKTFRRGGKAFAAVDDLCWSLNEGEISVLLGHNGAGKSTTMNLMTGMLEADGGDCYVYGHSVRHELSAVRQEIGLCPQHNILWPQLTVREHLDYYAAIKGLRGSEKEDAIRRLLAAVDLEDKEHYMSKALSGGQKRKLSVAVAFVGGSRLVILDEPTAGMDVGARRHTWSLLKEMAKWHTILLTTHFMDEADLLGDTVAIMSKGRLQCAGSNMFLKSKLGVGFVLTMSVVSHARRGPIEQMVQALVPAAEAIGSGAGEVAYRLPMASKPMFPDLLCAVEEGIPGLGINAYSLSATTLEEVFIKIAEGPDAERDADALAAKEKAEATDAVWNVEMEKGRWARRRLQFRAMMVKRLWNALRDRRTQFFQIVCPVACVLLAMLLTLVRLFSTPTIVLSSDVYGTAVDIPLANCEGVLDVTTPFSTKAHMDIWTDVPDASAFSTKLNRTYQTHAKERYGGVSCAAAGSGELYHSVFYNTSALHEVAIETANVFAAHLRVATGRDNVSVTTAVASLPKTSQQRAVESSLYAMMIAVIIMIPFTFIPSTFVGWIVRERECKARHLQNISGLSFYIYWLSNFLFDLCSYIVTMCLVIVVFLAFGRDEYVAVNNIGATFVVFLLYGVSGILMAYALSFAFDNHSTAQNVAMLVNFIVGFLLVLAVSALSLKESTRNLAEVLRWIFRIVPSYCVGEAINNLASLKVTRAFGIDTSTWDMDVVGWVCVYMAIEIPVFLFITLFIDHPGRRQRSQRLFHNPDGAAEVIEDEDEDVAAERRTALEGGEREGDLVRVLNLRKEYPNGKVAVRNIALGVRPGEVFGFLGTNGAGKTTTISILCQEFYPTSGRAYVCGNDIVTESSEALRCIGYCPQFDACLDLLTVEEHLYLYAGVRGISSRACDRVVRGLMKLCGLTEYRRTKSHELSGGNRRKLSVAVSLIGGPRVVFFDEPSAGMDPVARRGLWNAIETVADNCSVVLTTHHLEEVEALAHRVAIMVDGTLRCIGDKTHLKQKYGTGFEVAVRVADESPEVMAGVELFFEEEFPSSKLTEVRAGRFTYQLPNTVRLSSVFTALEQQKEKLQIRDYSVSQTSIEQVFMRISEKAELEHEEEHRQRMESKKSCCRCC